MKRLFQFIPLIIATLLSASVYSQNIISVDLEAFTSLSVSGRIDVELIPSESQHITVNTGGNYLAYDLNCKDTYIKVSSGSQGKVIASRIIEATANSKGYIGYIGNPVSANTKTSLGGEIASFKRKEDAKVY